MVDALQQQLAGQTPAERLSIFRSQLRGRLVFTTSLGLEDQVITHFIAQHSLDIEIITLDTGRLFAQTYDVWASTEQRYGIRIKAVTPQNLALEALTSAQGPNGFYHGLAERKACCQVRKMEPLERALAGAAGWIAGLRADQSQTRGGASLVSRDATRNLIKLNPLIDWSRAQTLSFAQAHDIPLNALHAEGFASIGCAPCTRALQQGETERAGRWWWEDDQKECGLHMDADGRLSRSVDAAVEHSGHHAS